MKEELIKQAREDINRIDKELATLFVQRMRAVEQVAEFKKLHAMPILDAAREQQILHQMSPSVLVRMLDMFMVEIQQS